MDARPGATLHRLTSFAGADDAPLSWSPDGRSIAYLQGSEPKYWLYDYYQLGWCRRKAARRACPRHGWTGTSRSRSSPRTVVSSISL